MVLWLQRRSEDTGIEPEYLHRQLLFMAIRFISRADCGLAISAEELRGLTRLSKE